MRETERQEIIRRAGYRLRKAIEREGCNRERQEYLVADIIDGLGPRISAAAEKYSWPRLVDAVIKEATRFQ